MVVIGALVVVVSVMGNVLKQKHCQSPSGSSKNYGVTQFNTVLFIGAEVFICLFVVVENVVLA